MDTPILHFEQQWVMWWPPLLETRAGEVRRCLSMLKGHQACTDTCSGSVSMLKGCGTASSAQKQLRWISLHAQRVWDSIKPAETPVMGRYISCEVNGIATTLTIANNKIVGAYP